MPNSYTIVGLGEALWDMLPTGKHLGGAPLNFAYIASLLGNHSVIATRVGDDSLGREMRSGLERRQLDTTAIQVDRELPTGMVDVQFQNGQPEYEIRQPAAWDAMEWSDEWIRIARACDAVCFGSLAQRASQSRSTILNFLENTRPGCLKVFDINLRKPFYSPDVIESSLRLSTVLKLNDLELPQVAGLFNLKGDTMAALMAQLLHKFDLKMVVVTRGELGAIATDGLDVVEHPGLAVRVSDTIGAGDAFSAASAHCLLRGMSLKKTLEVANRWASWVASQPGGMPVMSAALRSEMLETTSVPA
ncbi:MAG TPA: carbohydrate kinase [Terriglobales bacterium]|nr:carbohydrate kinase [Terriglobales bacterium]